MLLLKLLRTIFIKCFILFTLLCLFGYGIRLFLPFSWGSMQLNSKLSFIEENNLDPNIYFLGSSVTNRQVRPTLFDSIVGDENLSSFNLSIDGTMPPHHFYLLENLLERDETIDYIFMELDGFDHMPPRHFMTTFSKFYFTPKWFGWSILNLTFSKSIPPKQKLYMSYKYGRSFLENLFFVSMRFDALKSLLKKNAYSYKVLNRHKDGFMYFNTEFTENKTQSKDKIKLLTQTKTEFEEAYTMKPEQLKSNFVYKRMLKKYLKMAKKHDVKLFYVMTPRNCVLLSAEELLDIKNSFPDEIVLDLADPSIFPDLYKPNLRYDADHLNDKGSRIYTSNIAESFRSLKSIK